MSGKGKSGARVPPEEQVTIDTGSLLAGMSTVVDDKIDETLVRSIPAGACRGKHFKTKDNTNVCYLLGGKVTIKETNANHKRNT